MKIYISNFRFELLGIALAFCKYVIRFDSSLPYVFHGDSESYISPILNYINTGIYNSDVRLPGYGILIYLFHFLFKDESAIFQSIVIFQFFTLGISVGLILRMLNRRISSWPILIFIAVLLIENIYSSHHRVLFTESIAASLMVAIVYLLRVKRFPFFLGLFAIWLVFLKPITFPIVFIILFQLIKSKFSKQFIYWFFFPILLIEGSWIIRNALTYKKLVPLTLHRYYKEGMYGNPMGIHPMLGFIRAQGGSQEWWYRTTEVSWFFNFSLYEEKPNKNNPLPRFQTPSDELLNSFVYTSQFNLDSLKNLRSLVNKVHLDFLQNKFNVESTRAECLPELQILEKKFDHFSHSIMYEKPEHFFIKANLYRFSRIFYLKESLSERINAISIQPSFKKKITLLKNSIFDPYFTKFLFILVIALALISFVRQNDNWFCSAIILSIFFLYVCVTRQVEFRYFSLIYPVSLYLVVDVLALVYHRIKPSKM